MAGIFAPTLDTSSTVITPKAPIPGASYEGLLNTAAGVLKGFSGSGNKTTQRDKDDASLRPFVQAQNRLFKQRKSLGLRYRSTVKQNFMDFIENNPTLADDAKSLVSEIHNIDVGNELDPAVAYRTNLFNFLQKDPKGQLILSESITFNEAGEFDADATMSKADALYGASLKNDYDLTVKKERIEDKKLTKEESDLVKTEASEDQYAKHIETANTRLQGILNMADKLPGIDLTTAEGADAAIKMIDDLIIRTRADFREDAIKGGFADTYDLDKATAPLLEFKKMVENNRDNLGKFEKALSAENRLKIGEYFKEKTGMPPMGEEFSRFLDNWFLQIATTDPELMKGVIEHMKSPTGQRRGEDVWGGGVDDVKSPLADPVVDDDGNVIREGNEPTTVSPDTIFNEDMINDINEIPSWRVPNTIINLNGKLGTYTPEDMASSQLHRNEAAGDMMKLLGVNFFRRGQGPASIKQLRRTFHKNFMDLYKQIEKSDPVLKVRLQKALVSAFSTNITARTNFVDSRIQNIPALHGLRWGVDDKNNAFLYYEPSDPTLHRDVQLILKEAEKRGLGTDLSSLKQLDDILRRENVSRNRPLPVHLDLLRDVNEINKVNKFFKDKMPELGGSKGWTDAYKGRFTIDYSNKPTVLKGSSTMTKEDLLKHGPGEYIVDWDGDGSVDKVIVTADGEIEVR